MIRKTRRSLLIPGAVLIAAAQALLVHAAPLDTLSNVALFNRCYTHFTQLRAPVDAVRDAALRAGTSQTAINACMAILDKAVLQSTGKIANTGDREAKAVLKTFNALHNTWFTADKPANVPNVNESYRATPWIHDLNEPALHVTRALFTPGVPFKEIMTRSQSVEAIRSADGTSETYRNLDSAPGACSPASECRIKTYLPDPARFNDLSLYTDLNPGWLEYGELWGVRPISQSRLSNQGYLASYPDRTDPRVNNPPLPPLPSPQAPTHECLIFDDTMGPRTYYYCNDPPNGNVVHQPIQVNQSRGGGIIGTASYLLLNMGRPENLPMDGGIRMPRRWSKAVFKDLLCRDLPVLRGSDVVAQAQVGPLTPPFRKNPGCMACHTSMDGMAGTARNLGYAFFENFTKVQPYQPLNIMTWETTQTQVEATPTDHDILFHARPLNGRLVYRDFDGNKVDEAVVGIDGLGAKLSEHDDPYVCVASRYFRYFTGIGVNLQDIGNPSPVDLTKPQYASEIVYRNQVIAWGRALKSDPNQSLRTLILNILSDPLYRRASMRKGPGEL